MYKLCKTEESVARQRQLEGCLLEMMHQQHYDEITVSDLCKYSGTPRKAFYRYFSGKEGALLALIDHTMMEYEIADTMPRKGKARTYQQDLERYFRFWSQHRVLLDALRRSGLGGVLVERSIKYVLSGGMPSRFLRQEEQVAREHAITFGVCGLMSMVLQWHESGFLLPTEKMAQIAVELLTKPLFEDVQRA